MGWFPFLWKGLQDKLRLRFGYMVLACMRATNRVPVALSFFISILLVVTPSVCLSDQFKITEIYDGNTVRAERYDTQCLP
jgi:hypothetical protein